MNKFCNHQKLIKKYEVPFDIKSGKATNFGSVFRCKDCGIEFVHPLPSPAQIETHYDLPAYYTHDSGHLPTAEPSLVDRVIVNLAWRVDRGRPFDPSEITGSMPQKISALDIGCGSGDLLSKVRQLGVDTFGVEPDHIARKEAKAKGHKVYSGTAETIPAEIASNQYNLITMTHVLEHCVDPVASLENARNLLADDGIFYC